MGKYKEDRKALKNEDIHSKKCCFVNWSQEAEADPCGKACKVLTASFKESKSPNERCPKVMENMVKYMFSF